MPSNKRGKRADSDHPAHAQYSPGPLLSIHVHSVVSNGSGSGQ